MKIAVIGPKGGVLNVIDTAALTTTVPNATIVELTDGQAAAVAVIRAGKKQPFLINEVVDDSPST